MSAVDYVVKYDMIPAETLRKIVEAEAMKYRPAAGSPYNQDSMRRRNESLGQFYFSPDTVRFFNSRVNTILDTGVFVEGVTSPTGREYRVMWISPCGSVHRLTEFVFATMRTADRVARAFNAEIAAAGVVPREYTMRCD